MAKNKKRGGLGPPWHPKVPTSLVHTESTQKRHHAGALSSSFESNDCGISHTMNDKKRHEMTRNDMK